MNIGKIAYLFLILVGSAFSNELIDDARAGSVDKVQTLLDKGVDVNIRDDKGYTALIMASEMLWLSKFRYAEIIELLLEKNANVNLQNDDGYTALMFASSYGSEKIVELLLEKGADMDAKDKYGDTALILASRNGRIEIVKLLLERGADIGLKNNNGDTALIVAVRYRDADIANLLRLESALRARNIDVVTSYLGMLNEDSLQWFINREIKNNNNIDNIALLAASKNGYGEIVKFLLARGTNIDFQNQNGITALIWASYSGHTEIVKLLLERGASLNLQNHNGNTALILAFNRGHTEILKLLELESAIRENNIDKVAISLDLLDKDNLYWFINRAINNSIIYEALPNIYKKIVDIYKRLKSGSMSEGEIRQILTYESDISKILRNNNKKTAYQLLKEHARKILDLNKKSISLDVAARLVLED